MSKKLQQILFLGLCLCCCLHTFTSDAQQLIRSNSTALVAPVINQFQIERCGSDAYHEQQMSDPTYAKEYYQSEDRRAKMVANWDNKKSAGCPNGAVIVPVAVHFESGMGDTPEEQACLVNLVTTQIEVLNQDFNATNDVGCSNTNAGGACMTFVLATQNHPAGSGLVNGDPAITFDGAYTCPVASPCNITAWAGYMNIAVQTGTGVLGIAPLNGNPNANGAANTLIVEACGFGTDEIDCCTSVAGPNSGCGAGWPYTSGATTTHEVGHFFGLPHTFCTNANGSPNGDVSCTGAPDCDGFTDTPPEEFSTFGCPSGTCSNTVNNPCGGTIEYNNFMDYLNDVCMNTFTDQQTTEMNINASNDNFELSTISGGAPNCDLAILEDCSLINDGGTISVCPGGQIQLYELSSPLGDSFNWTIAGSNGLTVSPTSSTDLDPIVTVTNTGALAGGTLTITTEATNANGSCTATQTVTVNVLDPTDPACDCQLEVTIDDSAVTCQDVNGTILPTIPITVANALGTVWIDQDGNTTFDAAAGDIDITAGINLGFPEVDVTFLVYDSGNSSCVLTFSVPSGCYSCDGVTIGDPPNPVCNNFTLTADEASFNCLNAGQVAIPLALTACPAANVSFTVSPNGSVSGSGTTADPYIATLDITGTTPCPVIITATDDTPGIIATSEILEITSPASIAGGVVNVGTNAFPDWGIDINTVSPCVGGVLVAPTDGTAPETDFCEPTPPATPTAAQCNGISGNIAIIDRGACNFTSKAENAEACGAIAVVICNNDTDNPDQIINMAGTSIGPVTIPTISLSYNQCQEIYAEMLDGNNVEVCIGAPATIAVCEVSIEVDPCAFDCDNCVSDAACDDEDECTTDTCDGNGDCQYTPVDCDNNDVCDGVETCDPVAGCETGTPLDCDNNDICDGVETCDPIAGCETGTPLDCDNNNVCDGVETCDPIAGCETGTALDCDDGIVCTVDTCDPITGCENTPDDSACDNNNVCDGVEVCDPVNNGCIVSPGLNCDDNDPCNGVETCDPITGCETGTAPTCGDGICDVICGETFANCADCACTQDSDCDDSNVCNGVETCDATDGCVAGTALDCDDNVACTVDTCDPITGCANTPDDSACDNNDVCDGAETCDPITGCETGTALDCDDGIVCTVDTCDPITGCENTPDDSACDNNDVCDGLETCDAATGCVAGTALTCDDNDNCTIDTCDPILGCQYMADPTCTTCPTFVSATVDATEICAGDDIILTANTSDNSLVTFTWSVSINGGSATIFATGLGATFATRIYNTSANTSCDADTYEVTYEIICNDDNSTIQAGVAGTINAYPTFMEGMNYTLQEGECNVAATILSTCSNFDITGSFTPTCGVGSGLADVSITNTSASGLACEATTVSVPYSCNETCTGIDGCTDALADNYEPTATDDDGSCIYTGCTDATAINYNPAATTDDGSCIINAATCNIGATIANSTQGNNGGVTPFYYNQYDITITNGTGPYNYSWNTDGYVRGAILGLGAIRVIGSDQATWSVTVTDADGCIFVVSEDLISGPLSMPTLDIVNYDVTGETGLGNLDGAINISVGGGATPYSYEWSNGSATQDVIGLQYGWYSVTVTDANGETTMGWYWVPHSVLGRGKTTTINNDVITAYPNPFSSETTIEFVAGQNGGALLEVYDLAGAKVATLFDGVVEQNLVYKTPFNANQLASGVYFVRFVSPTGQVNYQKILLAN